MIASLLSSACQSALPPATLAVQSTRSTAATVQETVAPTFMPRQPTAQPLVTRQPATLTPQPSATATPAALFSVDLASESFATSTPIATPTAGALEPTLGEWSDQRAVAMLQDLINLAVANDDCIPSGCVRSTRQTYESAIRLVILDTLARFPETPYASELRWRLALSNAILDNTETDVWLLEQITEALNAQIVPLDDLSLYLAKRGFRLREPVPADNLFGDGRRAWLITVQTQNPYTDDGLFAALARDIDGHYETTLIRSDWSFNQGESSWSDVRDLTGNGTPEAIGYFGVHSGSMCGGSLRIYEWRTNHFEDLTGGRVNVDDCGDSWSFAPVENSSAWSLTVESGWLVSRQDRYELRSGVYVRVRRTIRDLPANRYGYALDLIPLEKRVAYPDLALDDYTRQSLDERASLGPRYEDFLHFQKAYFEAVTGDVDAAQATITDWVTGIAEPRPIIVRAGQAFAQTLQAPVDTYAACAAATQVLFESLTPYRAPDGALQWNEAETALGISLSDADHYGLCDLNEILPVLITRLDGTAVRQNPVDALRSLQAPVRDARSLDLNGDGRSDWLLTVDDWNMVKGTRPVSVWALLDLPTGLHLQRLTTLVQDPAQAAEQLKAATLWTLPDATGSFLMIPSTEGWRAYQVRRWADEADVAPILPSTPGGRYTYDARTGVLDLFDHRAGARAQTRYRWDPASGEFAAQDVWVERVLNEPPSAETVAALSQEVDRLGTDAPEYLQPTAARVAYLLALEQERLGDPSGAARTLRDLWQRHPDTPYARLAEYRLRSVP